jgi:hypothetical protein
MAHSRDKRTDEQKHEDMVGTRVARQDAAIILANELHDAGFSSVWIDSTQISGDGYYYCQVIIEADALDHDRMATVLAVAEVHDAKVTLKEVRMNQQSFSRIALWPFAPGDDE